MLRGRSDSPPQRTLRVYAFDPASVMRPGNDLTIRIPYEDVGRGPVGQKVAVIDYDATNQCYYEGVDVNEAARFGQGGLASSEWNPQFHQQMVYTVVMDTIRRVESSLGRPVKWRRKHPGEPGAVTLHIHPHAMQEANAYYDRNLRALLFGYFRAAAGVGTSCPGLVFTCLSHDIIVHETTHAILDGVREYFSEPTGPDAAAFHEGFADIVALLQHFSFKESLLETIQGTGGYIHRQQLAAPAMPGPQGVMIQAEIGADNPMVGLAQQFGEAMGRRKALRSALGTRPDPAALGRTFEAHDRGAILVAAVFDAFFSVYINRTRDLIRMAYPDGRDIVPNFLHADLANRLAEEAARTAARIQNICIRALDYCPPVDITFGGYLRALVTADRDVVADDGGGYRTALINAFRARGICPEGVASYGEDALAWDPYGGSPSATASPDFAKLWRDLNRYEDEPDRENEQSMYERLWGKAETFQQELGLAPGINVHAKSINHLQRVRPDGVLQRQIVAELVQHSQVSVDPADPVAGSFTFRGGTTVIINRQGEIRFSIAQPLHGPEGTARLARQRAFMSQLRDTFALAPYVAFDPARDFGFRGIHRGY